MTSDQTALPAAAASLRRDTSTPSGRVPVLYISAMGRSGTTVLGRVLGELPGAAYVGELNFFWSDGILNRRPCGCGLSLSECPYWGRVIDRLGPGVEQRAQEVAILLAKVIRPRHGLALLTRTGRRRLALSVGALAGHLRDLYAAVSEVFHCSLIVDSSKSPVYRYVLESSEDLCVDHIHIVRDPRAVADSWRRPKTEPVGTVTLPHLGAVGSSMDWMLFNLLTRLQGRYAGPSATVRYEDLMEDPQAGLRVLASALGRSFDGLDVSSSGHVNVGVSHSVAGNPNRFESGAVRLDVDNRWLERLHQPSYWTTTALTLPLLRKYGYRARLDHTKDDRHSR